MLKSKKKVMRQKRMRENEKAAVGERVHLVRKREKESKKANGVRICCLLIPLKRKKATLLENNRKKEREREQSK